MNDKSIFVENCNLGCCMVFEAKCLIIRQIRKMQQVKK